MAAAPFFLFFVFWYWAHGMTTYERWNDYDYAQKSLPIDKYAREFRGMVLAMDTGLGMLVSRRRFMTGSFNFVAPVPSFENNYWQGYAVRTSREFTTTSRASRMVYQYLGQFSDHVLATARKSGLCSVDELPSYHKALLLLDRPFK